MKTNRNIYLLALALCLGWTASAQQSTAQLFPGYWTFGLNAGLAYQSSDVQAKLDGFGFGATLGKNIYYRSGAPLAFDLRGRFLYTRQYGLDALRAYSIGNNRALNGAGLLDYTSYPAELEEPRGFVFQNHQTTTAELGLEGLITLNTLRERTGVHVGLFGGIGLDWFKARTDQADANGSEYFEAYANINENRSTSVIRNELEGILDGNYETIADGNQDNGSLKFMPSLGIELGLQLSPHFLVYGGHRVTFSGTDALDGQRFADPNNDLYHYTSLGLRWTINPKEDKPLARLPEIEMISPLGSPYTTHTDNGLIIANIRYVNSAADVDCIVNNRSVPFDYRNGRFSMDTQLKPGTNEVILIARNEHGQDRETVILVYKDEIITETPRVLLPQVRFINPVRSSEHTEDGDFGIRAAIDHVTDRRDVTFVVNGIERDFIFENGILRSNIALREGDNRVQIRARNTAGADAAEVIIIREIREPLPIVEIVEPTGSRVESRYQEARVTAEVRNVESRNNLAVTQNGRTVWNFDFDENKDYVIINLQLENGANTVVITARNRAGDARDEVTIWYQEPLPAPKYPPTVRISEPSRPTSSTAQPVARIEAFITNISDQRDIQFWVNGSQRSDFNFDSQSGRLVANVNLLVGNNDVVVRAINRDGEDQQSIAIRRIEEAVVVQRPPVVYIQSPANNSGTESAYANVRASIDNVNSKSDLTFMVNGKNVYDFDFNRGQFSADVNLTEGNNTIRIRASNRDGSDEATINIRYRKAPAPVVQITTPANNAEVSGATAQVRARMDHVNNKEQIQLIVNGRNTNFNLERNLREITATVSLIEGNNTIRVEAFNKAGSASDQISVRYRRAMPPTVSINAPANNNASEFASVNLRARVTNVSNRSEVTIRVNGNLVSNFSLNGGDLSTNVALREGDNAITVRVSNRDGSDEAGVNVRYEPLSKPVVTITDPTTSPFSVIQNYYVVRASVKKVDSKANISVLLNGSHHSLFNFDTQTGEVVIRAINLREGDNPVVVKATNRAGSTEAAVTLRYRTPKPPTVTITEPADGAKTGTNRATVSAIITNITEKRSISFKVNGKLINEFDLNGENFSGIAELQTGKNTIAISAQNADGAAEAVINVTLELKQAQLLKPNVRFVQPSKLGIVVKKESYNIQAALINVAVRGEIQMWVNGEEWADFDYNWRSKQLTSIVNLRPGSNTVLIKAQNKGGVHEAETTIVYEAGDVPVITIVSISQPTVNPFRPQVSSSTIIATVKNVDGKKNVKILVNNDEMNDFLFDISSNKLEATVPLTKGMNQIIIRAANESGTSEEKRTIEF